MNAHLLKDYVTDDPHCLHCGYEFERNVHYFLECPKYTRQRDILSQQFCDISVPFLINLFINGSSEYSHNLNCKIIPYVHNYIKSSRHFWHFCNIFFSFLPTGWIDWSILNACMDVCFGGFCKCMCVCVEPVQLQKSFHSIIQQNSYINYFYVNLITILSYLQIIYTVISFVFLLGRGPT